MHDMVVQRKLRKLGDGIEKGITILELYAQKAQFVKGDPFLSKNLVCLMMKMMHQHVEISKTSLNHRCQLTKMRLAVGSSAIVMNGILDCLISPY